MKSSSPEEKKKKAHVLKIVLIFATAILIISGLVGLIYRVSFDEVDKPEEISISDNVPEKPEASEEIFWTVYGELSEEMLQEEVRKTVVQIRADVSSEADGSDYTINGSGVVLDVTEEYIDIATASHVVELTAYPVVNFYDGSAVQGTVLAYGKESDVAFVRVEFASAPDELKNTLQAAKCYSVEEFGQIEAGEEIFCMGSVVKVADHTVYGSVKEKERFVELFQNDMLICDKPVDGGMSGGGVYGSTGKLLGIVVGTGDSESACVSVTDVLAEYRSVSNE